MGDGVAQNNHRQSQIGKKGDAFLVGLDAEAFQNIPKQACLLFPEYLIAFRTQPPEDLLLPFHGQNGDAVPLAIAAGVEKLRCRLLPGQSGICHQLPGIGQDPGLLQIQCLYNQILFCGKKGVKKGAGDAYRLIDLLHGGMLYTLSAHKFQCCGQKTLPDLRPLFLRIGNLRHSIPSLIKTKLIIYLYFSIVGSRWQEGRCLSGRDVGFLCALCAGRYIMGGQGSKKSIFTGGIS